MSLSSRIRRLEREHEQVGHGWKLDEPRKPDLSGDGFWAKLKRIRDNHPHLQVRSKSLMDMAEDLMPGLNQRVKKESEAYQASHEWRWIKGRCYVRERREARPR